MKRHRNVIMSAAVLFSLGAMPAIAAAPLGSGYSIVRHTIDSGGVTFSSGGAYELSGTIGQHDAGPLTGGTYTLHGGFWGPAVAAPEGLLPDPSGGQFVRAISFVVPANTALRGNAGSPHAVRVQLVSLHDPATPPSTGTPPDFSAFEGEYRYLNSFGGSINCVDSVTFGTGYFCGQLGCQPEYRDWATDLASPLAGYPQVPGLIYVFGDSVNPDSTYEASVIAESCGAAPGADSCAAASAGLALATSRWGDVAGAGNGPPDGAVTVVDLNFVKGKLVLDDQPECRAWLKDRQPNPGSGAVNVVDLGFVIDAVKGFAYPANQGAMTGFYMDACP